MYRNKNKPTLYKSHGVTSRVMIQGRMTLNARVDTDIMRRRQKEIDYYKKTTAPDWKSLYQSGYETGQEVVMQYDMLFSEKVKGKRCLRVSSKGGAAGMVRVFSSFNNAPVRTEQEWLDKYEFIGFAESSVRSDGSKVATDKVAVAVAGTVSTVNTSTQVIFPGDRIIYGPPVVLRDPATGNTAPTVRVATPGFPKSKIVAATIPVRIKTHGSHNLFTDYLQYLKDHDTFTAGSEIRALLDNIHNGEGAAEMAAKVPGGDAGLALLAAILSHAQVFYDRLLSRTVGIALKYAGPGDQLDLLVRNI